MSCKNLKQPANLSFVILSIFICILISSSSVFAYIIPGVYEEDLFTSEQLRPLYMRAFKIASRGYWYEFEELLEPLKKSLDLVIQDKDGKNLKAGRVLMASAYRYLGDLKRAREYIDFAGQTQEPTIPFVEFHYLAERSRIERFENKEEATFNTFKQAFVLASQSGLLYEAWLYALDLDLDSNEDKRIRVQRLEIALKAIKQINKDDFNATHNREILVYIYDEIGNFKRSLELNLENLENQPSEYIEEHVANIKLAIAKSYIGLKEYKKAMEAIQPYIDMHKEPYGDFAGDPDLTTDFNYFKCLGLVELGKILVGLGKFAEARKLQSELVECFNNTTYLDCHCPSNKPCENCKEVIASLLKDIDEFEAAVNKFYEKK